MNDTATITPLLDRWPPDGVMRKCERSIEAPHGMALVGRDLNEIRRAERRLP